MDRKKSRVYIISFSYRKNIHYIIIIIYIYRKKFHLSTYFPKQIMAQNFNFENWIQFIHNFHRFESLLSAAQHFFTDLLKKVRKWKKVKSNLFHNFESV